jgi:hypothetical protein
MPWILDMQKLQSSTESCLLAAITDHLLNMIISQVMLITRSRLATYANHALYEITFFHDYKIVNIIQEYIMQTITMSGVLCLNAVNKPSSISEDVVEIWINSQPCKGNNLTTRHMRATKANEWPAFAMTIKESGRILPRSSAVFHTKSSWAVRGWPDTIPSEKPFNSNASTPSLLRNHTTQIL